jgi:hypothetical protein
MGKVSFESGHRGDILVKGELKSLETNNTATPHVGLLVRCDSLLPRYSDAFTRFRSLSMIGGEGQI